jgi:hypothetical protein
VNELKNSRDYRLDNRPVTFIPLVQVERVGE